MSDTDPITAAIEHELRLLDPEVRADSKAVDVLLAADFTEIGSTGRQWSREATLAALTKHPGATSTAVGLAGRVIAPGVVLVSYDTAGSTGHRVRRSTLWRETPTGWQAVFHQGTPVTD